MKEFKSAILGALCIPLGLVVFFIYTKVVTYLDPVLTIVIGGGFWLAILAIVAWFIWNMKDFIKSIFKKDNSVNDKGFKKHF